MVVERASSGSSGSAVWVVSSTIPPSLPFLHFIIFRPFPVPFFALRLPSPAWRPWGACAGHTLRTAIWRNERNERARSDDGPLDCALQHNQPQRTHGAQRQARARARPGQAKQTCRQAGRPQAGRQADPEGRTGRHVGGGPGKFSCLARCLSCPREVCVGSEPG